MLEHYATARHIHSTNIDNERVPLDITQAFVDSLINHLLVHKVCALCYARYIVP